SCGGSVAASPAPNDQLLGSYLAGRYASAINNSRMASEYYLRALKSDPNNKDLLERAFSSVVADGRYDDAVKLAKRLQNNGITRGIARLVLLGDDIRQKRFDAALARTTASPDAGFGSLTLPLVRAWIIAGDGKVDDAIKELQGLDKNHAYKPFQQSNTALIYDFAGQKDKAIAAYETVVGSDDGVQLTDILSYANLLVRSGKRDRAKALLETFSKKFEANPLIDSALARVKAKKMPPRLVSTAADGAAQVLFSIASSLALGDSQGPATIYLRLATFLQPDFADAHLLLGDLLQRQNRLDTALQEYQDIAKSSPLKWNAQLRTAFILNQTDRSDQAIALLKDLVKERSDSLDALTGLADMLREQEHYTEARAYYDKAIKTLHPETADNWALYYARGVTYQHDNMWDLAEKDFLHALQLKPDQPYVMNYLGYSWIEQGRNLDRASTMIMRAAQLLPDDGYIVDSVGWLKYRRGDYKGAIEQLERAVLLHPEDPTINDHLGDAYWMVNRRLEARFQWRHALAMKPDSALAASVQEKLKRGLTKADNKQGS
ncbi:MAG TPA: tetratricopeptide repeat protein, partial [Alphaproteobacteria bacterium]|nr:tetratricopeptide repeat protein [Alphaproteobacteria bacterium]